MKPEINLTENRQDVVVFENECYESCVTDLTFQKEYYYITSHSITKVSDSHWVLIIVGVAY